MAAAAPRTLVYHRLGGRCVVFDPDLETLVRDELTRLIGRYARLLPPSTLLVERDREEPGYPHVFRIQIDPVVSELAVSWAWDHVTSADRERLLILTLRSEALRSMGALRLISGKPALHVEGMWIVGEGLRRWAEQDVSNCMALAREVGERTSGSAGCDDGC